MLAIPPGDLETLSDAIYEAAIVPETWPAVLDAISDLTGTLGGALVSAPPTASEWQPTVAPRARWTTSAAVAEMLTAYFREGWATRCEWTGRARAMAHPGFVTERDVFAPGEREHLPSYAFYRSHGIGDAAGLFLKAPSSDRFAFLFEQRYEDGPMDRATVERLDNLKPHLARAALLACRLGLERAKAATEALEILGLPAAVLSLSNRILTTNERMQLLMPDIVEEVAGGRIRLTDKRSDAMLSSALANTLLASSRAGSAPVFSVPVAARFDKPAMVAHVVPVRRQACDLFAGASSIVVMTPLSSQEPPEANVIQGLFDLTPAESRVARLIVCGGTVGTIAASSRTTEHTVRKQLKSVFAKTGVSRQAELVSLLNTITLRRELPQ